MYQGQIIGLQQEVELAETWKSDLVFQFVPACGRRMLFQKLHSTRLGVLDGRCFLIKRLDQRHFNSSPKAVARSWIAIDRIRSRIHGAVPERLC